MTASLRVSGHFGELLQGRIGPGGPVVLVTLPCPVLGVSGRWLGGPGLALHGAGQRLTTPETARRMARALGLSLRGRFALRAEMEAGGGAGVSTAALAVLARLAGFDGPPLELARACIAAEGASDPLMFPRPERLLWASRAGRVLADLPPLPRLEILGGFFGPPRRTDPADMRFPDISDLIGPWHEASRFRDIAAIGGLASASAARTVALRGLSGDPTPGLARETGALGWCIGHTGAARGVIFAPGTMPRDAALALRRAGFRNVVNFRAGETR